MQRLKALANVGRFAKTFSNIKKQTFPTSFFSYTYPIKPSPLPSPTRIPAIPVPSPTEMSIKCTQFDVHGKFSNYSGIFSKPDLCKELGLQVRDLRKIDNTLKTNLASILVREKCILVNLAHIRAVIKSDRVLFFNSFHSSPSHLQSACYKELEERLQNRLCDPDSLPFEFRVIEAILINVVNALQAEMESILPYIERLLLSLEDEHIDNSKIKLLLQYNKRLHRFHKKCLAIEDAISDLLDYEEELAGMHLTRKKLNPDVEVDDHTEIELLLESYLKLTEEITYVTGENISHLKSTEDIVNLALDTQRNRLLLLELKLNIGMIGITGGTFITSFFGMNLLNGMEESVFGFGFACLLTFITTGVILKTFFRRLQALVRTRL